MSKKAISMNVKNKSSNKRLHIVMHDNESRGWIHLFLVFLGWVDGLDSNILFISLI